MHSLRDVKLSQDHSRTLPRLDLLRCWREKTNLHDECLEIHFFSHVELSFSRQSSNTTKRIIGDGQDFDFRIAALIPHRRRLLAIRDNIDLNVSEHMFPSICFRFCSPFLVPTFVQSYLR